MAFILNLRVILLLASIIQLLIMLLYYFFRGKRSPLFTSIMVYQLLLFIWVFFELIEAFATSREARWLIMQFKFFPIAFIGIAWFVFATAYAGYYLYKKKIHLILLLMPCAIFYMFLLTNEHHFLFFSSFELNKTYNGIVFWLYFIYAYTFIIAGFFYMIKSILKDTNNRFRSVLFIVHIFVPIIVNLLHIFKIIDPGFDLTPLCFPLSFVLLFIVIFKYRFLNIMPIALKNLFYSLDDFIIVADIENNIVEVNTQNKKSFHNIHLASLNNIQDFTEHLKRISDQSHSSISTLTDISNSSSVEVIGEVCISHESMTHYLVKSIPVLSINNDLLGRIISFFNITNYKNLLIESKAINKEMIALNDELRTKNLQLEEHINTVKELSTEKERNRISKEIHDIVGHTLTTIVYVLKSCRVHYDSNTQNVYNKIEQAIDISSKGLSDIKTAISEISDNPSNRECIVERTIQITEKFNDVGIQVDLSIYGHKKYEYYLAWDSAYLATTLIPKICKEAITNALNHGNASTINIVYRFFENYIEIFIIDNGSGCYTIKRGMGIAGMEERVERLGGKITYGSDGESGFNIHIIMNYGRVNNDKSTHC